MGTYAAASRFAGSLMCRYVQVRVHPFVNLFLGSGC